MTRSIYQGPEDIHLRGLMLALERALATGAPISYTAPDVLASDDQGNPTGVGVIDLDVDVAGATFTLAELHRAGLAVDEVPHLRILDPENF